MPERTPRLSGTETSMFIIFSGFSHQNIQPRSSLTGGSFMDAGTTNHPAASTGECNPCPPQADSARHFEVAKGMDTF